MEGLIHEKPCDGPRPEDSWLGTVQEAVKAAKQARRKQEEAASVDPALNPKGIRGYLTPLEIIEIDRSATSAQSAQPSTEPGSV